jgi:3-hydroxybutyryl-CoA dehydratase
MSELAYEDIKVGEEASLARTITKAHVVLYAGLTGDMNPVHVDAEQAAQSMFGERIAHGMLVAGLISAVLGTQLPGPNSIYLGQDLKFTAPVKIGDAMSIAIDQAVPPTIHDSQISPVTVPGGAWSSRETDGTWLITHDHVSVPLDVASGRALLNLTP